MADHKTGEVCQPGHSAGSGPRVAIQYLTYAQKTRRDDWCVARVVVHEACADVVGLGVFHYAHRGRLSVGPVGASGARITDRALVGAILEAYHKAGVPDRYAAERDLYGIWAVAPCGDGGAQDDPLDRGRQWMIHRVDPADPAPMELPHWAYTRIAAPTLAEALWIAERQDTPGYYSYGIMAADYDVARAEGINFFAGDGLLI